MDSIISYFEDHDLSMSFYQESASTVNARLTTTVGSLLSGEELAEAISKCWDKDKARVSMESELDENCVCDSNCAWLSELDENCVCDSNCAWLNAYSTFLGKHEPNDQVTLDIHVDKKSDVIGIYKFTEYWREVAGKSTVELLIYFSELLQKNGMLAFRVMDASVEITTQFIHIGNNDSIFTEDRKKYIKKYYAASLFLNRTSIILIPEDFHIIKGSHSCEAAELFDKLESVMSMVYLANSAYISNDKLVLQLKTDATMEYPLTTLEYNAVLCELCNWVYDCDNAVERAGIARNIVSLHCNNIEEFLNLGDDIISSVKSNYVIYQRNTTQEYIETKNKIAESVISLVKEQEELIKDIGDGFRNNFIAIFTFIITVVLAGVDVDDLTTNSLPWTVKFVAALIIVASAAYLLVCFISSSNKICSLEDIYGRIKRNYEDVLDPADLNKSFGNTYEETVSRVKKYRMCLCIIWIIFIVIMIGLLVYFSGVDLSWLRQFFTNPVKPDNSYVTSIMRYGRS